MKRFLQLLLSAENRSYCEVSISWEGSPSKRLFSIFLSTLWTDIQKKPARCRKQQATLPTNAKQKTGKAASLLRYSWDLFSVCLHNQNWPTTVQPQEDKGRRFSLPHIRHHQCSKPFSMLALENASHCLAVSRWKPKQKRREEKGRILGLSEQKLHIFKLALAPALCFSPTELA